MNSIVFASLKNTFDKNPENHEMPLEQFVEFVCNTAKRLSVDPNWTKAEYDAAKIKQRAIAPVGGRRKDAILESSFVPFDFDHLTREQYRTVVRTFKSAPFFNIMHTTASDGHACKNGDRALRVLIPTATVFSAADTWMIQRVIMDELALPDSLRDHCTEDSNRMVYLPHRESKITVTEGRLLRPRRYIARGEEMGLTKRERKELVADEHGLNADIAHFCEAELGLDALSSGRGYEVPCPNEHLHTGKGSTSIMLDGKEARFVCQHTNNGACTELNRHQHLALRMCGLPDELNVDKHPISLATLRKSLPDLPEEEIEELHRTENEESVSVTVDDLEDEEELPEPVKSKFVVEGLIDPDSIGAIYGESGTYKSYAVLGVMAASAAGKRFAGGDTSVAHHFYIDGEGGSGTETRLRALAALYGEGIRKYIHVIDPSDIDPVNKTGELIRKIRGIAGDEPVGLVAFDTLNQAMAPYISKFDEHSASTDNGMGRVVAVLKQVKEGTKGAVMVVHHTPKGGKSLRGSGALHGGIDWALLVERAADLRINITNTKQKHGVQQRPFGMALDVVQFDKAPPPKVYDADELDAPRLHGANDFQLFVPEVHRAPVLMPFAYQPFALTGNVAGSDGDPDAEIHAAIASVLTDTPQTQKRIMDRANDVLQNRRIGKNAIAGHLQAMMGKGLCRRSEDKPTEWLRCEYVPSDAPSNAAEEDVIAALEERDRNNDGYSASQLGVELSVCRSMVRSGKIINAADADGYAVTSRFKLKEKHGDAQPPTRPDEEDEE